MSKQSIAELREDYRMNTLEKADVLANPIQQFAQWFEEAQRSELPEPNAMTLATATPTGIPSARTLLLKGFSDEGFVFYTNYQSRKGMELAANPHAAILFCWLELERQVRIEGTISKLSAEASTHYFQSRPKGSQIGAWASPQSQVIEERSFLEEQVQNLQAEYATADSLPRPAHWGGYVLKAHMIEFWQGRSSRLHDRIRCRLTTEGRWEMDRLAP